MEIIRVGMLWSKLKSFQVEQYSLKGALSQNIFIIRSGHIGHINFFNIGSLNKFI